MMDKRLQNIYGLKFNPFSPDLPIESCLLTEAQQRFCWRVEQLAHKGGFAQISGEVGMGKSVTLRLLVQQLSRQSDLKIVVLSRPQSSLADFYRELGEHFGVVLSPSNRWNGTKMLRDRWKSQIAASRLRPLLIVDEAQLMQPSVLQELRLLGSDKLDSQLLLTVVLGGDEQLLERLNSPDLRPLASRMRVKLHLTPRQPKELEELLAHVLEQAGQPGLLTASLRSMLCQNVSGNVRLLMTICQDLLDTAQKENRDQIDEQLYMDLYGTRQKSLRGSENQSGSKSRR